MQAAQWEEDVSPRRSGGRDVPSVSQTPKPGPDQGASRVQEARRSVQDIRDRIRRGDPSATIGELDLAYQKYLAVVSGRTG
jgi:hypothetical protein